MIREYETTVSVLDFGAVGDGKTDCTASFQAAIDAVAPLEGMVVVPAGAYVCGYLRFREACAIVGESAWNETEGAGSRILFRGDADAPCQLDIGDCYGAVIHGLSLEGRHLGTNVIGIRLKNERGRVEDTIHLENCRIAGYTSHGLEITGMWCDSIRHCLFYDNEGYGAWLQGADIFITDDTFSYNRLGGLYGQEFNAGTMTGNRFEHNGGPGMLYRSGHVVHFVGNSYVDNDGPGLVLAHRGQLGNCNAIVGNLFSGNGRAIGDEAILGAAGEYDCHAHFDFQLNCAFVGNAFVPSEHNPKYAVAHQYTWAYICTNNAMEGAMRDAGILDLGGHNGYDVYANNPGTPAANAGGWRQWHDDDKRRRRG